jgi:hypothetical protein
LHAVAASSGQDRSSLGCFRSLVLLLDSFERSNFWKRGVRASLTLNAAACPIVVVTNDSASELACRML